jgi:pilus assembly protein CpaC
MAVVVTAVGIKAQDLWAVPVAASAPEMISLRLPVGKSQILSAPVPIKRASIANPAVADTVLISTNQIYLIAKTMGATTLTLWREGDQVVAIYDIAVSPDLPRLQQEITAMFPEETALRIAAGQDSILLSGRVSSAAVLTRVLATAESYAPTKVRNMIEVEAGQQVLLEVRIAEMNRALIKRLGFNLNYAVPGGFGVTLLNQLSNLNFTPNVSGGGPIDQVVTSAISAVGGFKTGNMTWTMFIDALKEQDLVKVLARPALVSLSGQEAAFLAGGEFPIPVPQAFGVTTIQFKKFGVGLNFTPTVLSDQQININVAPEVSELDFANGLRQQGFNVPLITTRRASTVIQVKDGQSFMIGGLLKDNVTEIVRQFPVLGDIPILGALFRSSQFQKNESELVIIVSTHMVKPLKLAEQRLPTDYYVEPNDFEFYLMGMIEQGGFGGETGKVRPGSESVAR